MDTEDTVIEESTGYNNIKFSFFSVDNILKVLMLK